MLNAIYWNIIIFPKVAGGTSEKLKVQIGANEETAQRNARKDKA